MTFDEVTAASERLGWVHVRKTLYTPNGDEKAVSLILVPDGERLRIASEHAEPREAFLDACRLEGKSPY